MSELTPQQEKFAQCVGSGMNFSDAYRSAYKVGPKTKAESVNDMASKLMANPSVSQRVAQIQAGAAEKAGLDAAETMREIRRISLSDIAGIMHPDGRVRLPHELDPATRAAVASFKIDEYGRIEYKFWDKNAALEKAAKIQGLFEKDNKQKAVPLVGEVRLVALEPTKKESEV